MKNKDTKKSRATQTHADRVWNRLRLRKNRPMTTISIRLPADVIEDLKDIEPALGYSGYQPLAGAYIGRGLREELERLENSRAQVLAASLRKRGMSDSMIAEVIEEARVS